MTEDVEAAVRRHPLRHREGVQRVDQAEGGPEGAVGDARLRVQRFVVEDADARRLAAGPGGRGDLKVVQTDFFFKIASNSLLNFELCLPTKWLSSFGGRFHSRRSIYIYMFFLFLIFLGSVCQVRGNDSMSISRTTSCLEGARFETR